MKHDQYAFAAPPNKLATRRAAVSDAYGGDVADRVRRFLPMVRRLAWHVHGAGRPGIEVDDLMQAGLVALTECATRHVGPGEDGFAAYAKMRVRGAMIDLVRRSMPLSRGAGERRRALRTKEDALRVELGREPSAAELAAAMGVKPGELAMMRAADVPLRFEPIDEVYSDAAPAFADAAPDSLTLLADEEMRGHVARAIGQLPERPRLVIQLYFVEELNLAEIAQVLSVSVPRVCQIKAQAIAALRQSLAGIAEVA